MFSTIMLAPALFETTPNRKHQHINRTNVLDKMIKYGMIIDILRMNLLRMD